MLSRPTYLKEIANLDAQLGFSTRTLLGFYYLSNDTEVVILVQN